MKTAQWYLARVKKVQPHLGYGFVNGQQVFIREGFIEGQWIVYNNGLADRRLTIEQCQESIETVRRDGKPVLAPERQTVERNFQFNLTR